MEIVVRCFTDKHYLFKLFQFLLLFSELGTTLSMYVNVLSDLKQEYEKIGLQVFHSFKESFFQGLEDFLARRNSERDGMFGGGGEEGDLGGAGMNQTEALFG